MLQTRTRWANLRAPHMLAPVAGATFVTPKRRSLPLDEQGLSFGYIFLVLQMWI